MTGKLTVSRKFHIAREGLGRKQFREGEEAAKPAGRIQRVSRVMALAIECDRLISDGVIKNQSALAHYAQVTTARMTHIMWLTNLAPEIQEAILFLPRIESGPDTVKEIVVRRIARVMDWGVQRGRWREYLSPSREMFRVGWGRSARRLRLHTRASTLHRVKL